jgi:hypothetical protein
MCLVVPCISQAVAVVESTLVEWPALEVSVAALMVPQIKQLRQLQHRQQLEAVAAAVHIVLLATLVAATVDLALLLFATRQVQLEVLLTLTRISTESTNIFMLQRDQHLTHVLCTRRRFGRIQLQLHAPLCVHLYRMMVITHLESRITKSLRSFITLERGTTTRGIQKSQYEAMSGNTLRLCAMVVMLGFM